MGFFDKLKAGWDNVSRSTDLMQKIQKGETTSLSDDDRKFFEEYNKKTPEAYLEEWEEQQAQKAEKEKERALQKAENDRIKALKKAETQYDIGGLKFRKSGNGLYYFGKAFQEGAGKFKLVDFIWDGPQYNLISKTTGKNKTHGRAGSALVGAAVAGPVGAMVGASLGKKTKVNTTTTTKQQELDTVAFLVFESAETGTKIQKEIKCNTNIANEVRRLSFN
jgi:hypothetical protein